MAYRAEIQIGVVGIGQLGALQKALNQVSNAVDVINKKQVSAGFNIQNINTYNAQLEKAWKNINKAALGSQEELQAVRNLVQAKNNQIAAQERLNRLIEREELMQRKIVATANAGFGEQGPALPPIPRGQQRGQTSPIRGGRNYPGSPGAREAMFENLALGAGFPLLFGGGAGQVAGGLLGSFVGTGFGGQILGSAIGQQLEDALRRVSEINTALNRLDMDALRDSVIAVNSELDTTVRRLIEAGKYEEARLAIGKQITQQTGLLPEYLSRSAQATNALNTAWSELTGAVSGLLSVAGTEVVTVIAAIIQGIAKVTQGATLLVQIIKDYVPGLNLLVSVIKLLGKVLPKVSETAEQLTAKIREATDAGSRQLSILLQQEDVDKRRVRGSTAWAQIQNNELDRQSKIIDIRQKGEDNLLALRKEYAGITSEEGLKELQLREEQLKAETAIAERTVNREAARKREAIVLQETLEKVQATLVEETSRLSIARELADQQERIRSAQVTAAATANKLENDRLNVQKQSSLNLKTDLDVNNKIAANRVSAAAQELQDAKIKAAFSISEAENQAVIAQQKAAAASKDMETLRTAGQLTELKRVELQTVISGARVAESNIETTRKIAAEAVKSAEAVERATRATIERERREQLVALAAAESTRQLEQAERIATERVGKLNNQLTLTTAIADAQRTINDIELDSLRTKLNQTTNEEQRAAILNRIQEIEIYNASLTLTATRAQIQAEVLRQKIALKLAEAKYKEYEAVVRLAEAQGVQQRAHYEALDAQASALRMSHDSYNTAVKIADVQWKTADAVYQGAVNAARMRRELAATSAVQSNIRFGQGLGEVLEFGTTRNVFSLTAMATGGFVKQPTFALIGEGGQGEYVVPESKAAAFAMNYMLGARGAGAIDGNASSPAINITTGPVMQQGGQNYVTIQDMEAGLQAVADTILNNSRSYSSRRFTGVA